MFGTAYIDQLDDARAIKILTNLADVHLDTSAAQKPDAAFASELAAAFDTSPAAERPSDGELARTALQFLAQDPQFGEIVRDMASQDTPKRLDFTTVAITSAAIIFALQTHIKIGYKDGKWQFHLEKKPTSENLLTKLVQGISSRLGGSS
jgi:hypothetical protein